MQKIAYFLKTPYYFQWLIVFFVLHNYCDFIWDVSFSSMLLLILKLSIAGWVLFFVCGKIYKNRYKAALLVSVMLFCYFFFGAFQDYLSTIKVLAPLTAIRAFFLINVVVCAIMFIGLFLYKGSFLRLTKLLNLLFFIYITFDVAVILWKQVTPDKKKMEVPVVSITPVPKEVAKPDIYFILLDSYLGSAGLKDYFNYDNTRFESFLKQKGFYVCNKSLSNYSYTIFSMASLFNMGYIDSFYTQAGPKNGYRKMAGLINHNKTWSYFHQLHYNINNLSPFVVDGLPPKFSYDLTPAGIDLITDNTAYNRVVKNLPHGDLLTDLNLNFVTKFLYKELADENEGMMKAALSQKRNTQPAFSYLHLVMPHWPYLYDSTGQWSVLKKFSGSKRAGKDSSFLNYLVYTNNRISRFIDDLYQKTNGKAVIMLMSDHGYRSTNKSAGKKNRFFNLNAIYLPSRDYHLWYDSVSNVNQFPILFNTLFGQQIPLQKDSCRF